MVERFNRTYREEVLDHFPFDNLKQTQMLTSAWMWAYNNERPHGGLKYHTPTEFLLEFFNFKCYKLREDFTWIWLITKSLIFLSKSVCSTLEILNLSSNQLMSLPKEFGNLITLKQLSACSNHSALLPEQIGRLKGLEKMDLWGNNLQELPKEISRLKNLESQNHYGNKLTGLPKEIGSLEKLKDLDLWANRFESLP